MASLWLALRHNANPLPISTLNPYDTGDQFAHRELPKLPSFAIFASLFRPNKFRQALEIGLPG
jgi:hypothetical protein